MSVKYFLSLSFHLPPVLSSGKSKESLLGGEREKKNLYLGRHHKHFISARLEATLGFVLEYFFHRLDAIMLCVCAFCFIFRNVLAMFCEGYIDCSQRNILSFGKLCQTNDFPAVVNSAEYFC